MKGVTLGDAAILMAESDNVATALDDLDAGREFEVDGETVTLRDPVEFGHKFALAEFEIGDRVRKYDEVIGEAAQSIAPGEWVHTHNVQSIRARPDDEGESPEGEA